MNMMKSIAILLVAFVACSSALPSMRQKRSYGAPVAAPHAYAPVAAAPVAYAPAPALVPAVAQVPALAAVPTLTAVHSQRLIPQPPDVHTIAHPTTVLQTVQTGNAIVGHQKVADQIVGKTADVSGYAFQSEVRHDAPIYAPAPAIAIAAAPIPVPVVAAPAPIYAPPVVAAPVPAPLALPAPAY